MPVEPHSLQAGSLHAGTVILQLLIVFALVLLNGFFVAAEFALVSVRRTRIDQMAAEGNAAAGVVQRAIHDLDRYIAATQVGITVASLLLGGIGEKTLEPLIDAGFHALHVPETFLGVTRTAVAFVLAYAIMTALHVVIGELMPKSIALQKSESTSLWVGRPMLFFARLFAPIIFVLNGTGNFLLRRIGIHAADGHAAQVHSPEELDLLFTQSHEGGQLTQTERELLHRVVKFSDLTAREAMIPRVEMQAIPVEMEREEFFAHLNGQRVLERDGKTIKLAPHTRTPVFRESMDEIIGIAHLKDLVRFAGVLREDKSTSVVNLMPLAREALRVPETITIDKLLGQFQLRRQQMAIVIDEYGGTAGLITMGDLLSQVFGDVHDEFDKPEPEIVTREDGIVLLAGRVLISEINERYGVGFRCDDADTMAGLVLNKLGRPAVEGDEVTINDVHLKVLALDRLRIIRLQMTVPAAALARAAEQG